jgi:hypothetical protein
MTCSGLKQGKCDERLSNIIDRVLNQILGKQAAETFYVHLQNTHSIHRQNIPNELRSFNSALREYFGAAAGVIEEVIHKNPEFAELEAELDLAEKSRIVKLV